MCQRVLMMVMATGHCAWIWPTDRRPGDEKALSDTGEVVPETSSLNSSYLPQHRAHPWEKGDSRIENVGGLKTI